MYVASVCSTILLYFSSQFTLSPFKATDSHLPLCKSLAFPEAFSISGLPSILLGTIESNSGELSHSPATKSTKLTESKYCIFLAFLLVTLMNCQKSDKCKSEKCLSAWIPFFPFTYHYIYLSVILFVFLVWEWACAVEIHFFFLKQETSASGKM